MDNKTPAPSSRIVRGESLGESSPPWGWFSHVLFISMAVGVWRDPSGKFWPSGSARGFFLYLLIAIGAAGGAVSSPTFQVLVVTAGLWSFYLAHLFCRANILKQL